MIPPARTTRASPAVLKRRTEYLAKMRSVQEHSLEDVTRCVQGNHSHLSKAEIKKIFKYARLPELTNHPLRTLRRFTGEMKACLAHGNAEAHYIEGIKQYFAFNNTRKGIQHLRFSSRNNYAKGNYLLALLKLVTGDHAEGMRLMDLHNWKNDLAGVDKLWRQIKLSLREVPIISKKEYGLDLMLILPPRSCKLNELDNRCSTCFYYKQIEKFMQLVFRG